MKKYALYLALVFVTGCGGVLQQVVDALPTVIQYVQDASMILDAIDRAATPILAQQGALVPEYTAAMDAARQSLQVALRSAEGGKSLSEEDLDKAFSDFRQAYAQLTSLLEQAGLMRNGRMAAAPGAVSIDVPEPLALQ